MYSKEYETKMSNGLHSSFLTLYCLLGAIFSVVGAIGFVIEAFVTRNWWELLSIPIAAVAVLVCLYLGKKAQEWGMRNLDEAAAIRKASWEQEQSARYSSGEQ